MTLQFLLVLIFLAINADVWCSELLTTNSSGTCTVHVACIVGVHSGVDSHVLNIIQRLSLLECVVARCKHLAHVVGLLAQQSITLASAANIATLLAPERAAVVPLEGFLAGGVTHPTIVVPVMGQTC